MAKSTHYFWMTYGPIPKEYISNFPRFETACGIMVKKDQIVSGRSRPTCSICVEEKKQAAPRDSNFKQVVR